MNRIVQLSEWEYEQLKKEAEMTSATIDAEIKREMENHCNLTVVLKLELNRDWDDVFHIKPVVSARSGSYSSSDDYHNSVYALSYNEVKKIQKKITEWMEKQVRERYKLDIETVNKYRIKIQNQWKWNLFFLLLSLTGWLVACFCFFS